MQPSWANVMDLPPTQVNCVAQAVYHEARGESRLGQRAIAHVVLNRAKRRNLTPCQIIRQPGQFHFNIRRTYRGRQWARAYQIALNPGRDPTAGALYFHNRRASPRWSYRITTSIDNHIFYK